MKKEIILALGLLAAAPAFAGTICTAGVASGGSITAGTIPTFTLGASGSRFVESSFPVKCSANVEVSHQENQIAFVLGSLSLKGKSIFEGSSSGGAIRPARACTGTCTAGTEATNLGTLLTNATL